MNLYEFFGVPTYEENKDDPKSRDRLDSRKQQDEEKLENDLYWFILDDDQLHKEYFIPLAHEINKKIKSKDFDRSEYIKRWAPMINKGCMKFYDQQEMTEHPKDIFSKDLRKSLCQRISDQSITDIEKGEYNLD